MGIISGYNYPSKSDNPVKMHKLFKYEVHNFTLDDTNDLKFVQKA